MAEDFWETIVTLTFAKAPPNDGLAFGGMIASTEQLSMRAAVRKVLSIPQGERRYWKMEAWGVGELEGDQIVALASREGFLVK